MDAAIYRDSSSQFVRKDRFVVGLQLTDLIDTIRNELAAVDENRIRDGAEPLFELERLELELRFTVEQRAAGKTGFDIKVLTAGGEETLREELIQTVKISYRFVGESGTLGGRAHWSSITPGRDPAVEPLP
jgi:hypothetical protein